MLNDELLARYKHSALTSAYPKLMRLLQTAVEGTIVIVEKTSLSINDKAVQKSEFITEYNALNFCQLLTYLLLTQNNEHGVQTKVINGHTCYGYIPVSISVVSEDGNERVWWKFNYMRKLIAPHMLYLRAKSMNMGWGIPERVKGAVEVIERNKQYAIIQYHDNAGGADIVEDFTNPTRCMTAFSRLERKRRDARQSSSK